jgi:hypothetical protein
MGDGIEKAILLANIIKDREKDRRIKLVISSDKVVIHLDDITITWPSDKKLNKDLYL